MPMPALSRTPALFRALSLTLLTAGLAACVPTSSGRGGGSCVDGEAEACACPDGTSSLRTCEGERFGPCPCEATGDDGVGDTGAPDADPGDDGGRPDACRPLCGERACGDDGCGGACGTCEAGAFCTPEGQCAAEPESCGDDTCDADENCLSCAADCGCGPDEVCDPVDATCGPPPCEPACDGRACGDDGCGGECGACEAGERCADGQCVEDDPCPDRPCDILWAARCTDDATGRVLCVPDAADGCPGESRRIACDSGRECAEGACAGATTDVEIMFLLDRSSSMADGRWNAIGDAIQGFAATYGIWHRMGVRTFPGEGCAAGPVPPLVINAAVGVRTVLAAGTAPGDQTPIADAFTDLAPAFGDFDEAQIVVLITDGTETCADNDAALLDAIDDLRRRGIDLHVIGVGPRADRELLGRLAQRAGREADLPAIDDGDDMARWLDGLLDRYDATRCDHDGIACDGEGLVECRDRRVVEARTCPDLCVDGEGCLTCWPPDTTRCVDAQRREVCGDDGDWQPPEACPYCLGDDCVECEPGASECVDETRRRVCGADGRWQPPVFCAHCLDGDCVICRPGATRCATFERQETCGANGAWGDAAACVHCLGDGDCVDCRPGAVECADDVRLRTCDDAGRWQVERCDACVDDVCRVCRPGETRCVDGTSDQTCTADGAWGPARECDACADGQCRFIVEADDVRLVDGARPSEGRVEVRHNGEWGHLCGRDFDRREAQVICRQLGLPTETAQHRFSEPFGRPPQGQVAWLDSVACTGDEARLTDCDLQPWLIDGSCTIYGPVSITCLAGECRPGDVRCADDTHSQACGEDELWREPEECAACIRGDFLAQNLFAGECRPCRAGQTRCLDADTAQTCGEDNDWDPAARVDCATGCADGACVGDGEVRLVDGPVPYAGRVEIRHNGEWGRVCGRNFDPREGRVICRQLGLPTETAQPRFSDPYGRAPADQPAWLDSVACTGDEEAYTDCDAPPWLVDGTCAIYGQVSLACLEGECFPGDTRCADDTHVEVCGDDQLWQEPEECAACVSGDYLAQNVFRGECRPCRAGQTRCLDAERAQTCGEEDDWNPDAIVDCPDGCAEGACVGDGEVRLVDGPEPWAGRVEIRHNGEWGRVCGRNFDPREGRVICRQLGLPTETAQQRFSEPYGRAPADQPAWIDSVACRGDEEAYTDCDTPPWLVDGNCAIYGQVSLACLEGECVPGDVRCSDDTHIQACGDDQLWQAPEECPACVSGDYLARNVFAGECRPCRGGQTRCIDADRVQICGEDNDWDADAIIDCPDGCVGDACVGG